MISRREVVTAGVLGTLVGSPADLSAEAAAAKAAASQDDAGIIRVLNEIEKELERLNGVVDGTSRVTGGFLGEIRGRFTTHLRAAGRFPEFMEIGIDPFYEVYDWHVRHQQQIQITRISDQRFAIQWMFTQLILRYEQDPKYLGIPFDRG
ncbi:MAG TPA: hypothetical protein VFZ38_21335 [Vicinamibacterales bacterium]|jgi:hypothetical protein